MDDKYLPILLEIKGDIGEIKKGMECLPDHEKRIRDLESAPAGKWRSLMSAIIATLCTLGGGVAAKIIFK